MNLDFIKKNWILLVLLLTSFAITIAGAYQKCVFTTVIGAFLSLSISIFNAVRSYQTNKKVKEKLKELDNRTTWHVI